jgi:prevent-host-death family protein
MVGGTGIWTTATDAAAPGVANRESVFRSDIRPHFATLVAMKQISIHDLKAHLSAAVAEAQAGETILITRHSQPVAQLGPPRRAHVHRGSAVGTGPLRPALKRATKGRYLDVLLEDRGNR